MKARFLIFTLLMCSCVRAQENSWTSDVGQGIYESRLRNLDGYFFTIDCGTELSPMGKNASAFLEKNGVYYESSKKSPLKIKINNSMYFIPFGKRSSDNDHTWRNILGGIVNTNTFSIYVNNKLQASFSYNKNSAKKNILSAENCLNREF